MTQTATSSGRALDVLRELILHGEFSTGSRLGEAELAARLGVSRTPVREALTRLAAEGLVELTPNRGARVSSWSVTELEGVFGLRTALEPKLTALAATAAGRADVDELDMLAADMVDVGSPGPSQNLDALVPLNRAFHAKLVALADRPALAGALASAIHTPVVLRNFRTYDEQSLRRSLDHHSEIVAALRAGDPEWARAVMTAHIRNARSVMVQAAKEQEKA